jgi:hypothetical protein
MITRRTTNNWMELKQAFSRDTSTYEVIITMTLKNTSGRQLFINLDRYADWDVPGYYGDDYTRTSDLAVQAWNLSGEHASISLSTSATDYPTALHGRYSDWYSRDLAYCGAGVSSSETGPDDFVGRVNHYFEIPPGASKTVRVYYRRQ